MTRLLAGRRRWVVVAALLGFVVRFAWVLYASRKPLGLYDPARYARYAERIADGLGYSQFSSGDPTAYYPPGYPFFLGAIEWVIRRTPLPDDLPVAAGLIQAGLGAITVILGAFVARRVVGWTAAVITAFVLALYPNLVWHSGAILGETLYNALFMGFLAMLLGRPWGNGLTIPRLMGAAALFGAALMVRPISVAVLPALALAWWVDRRDPRVLVRRLAVFAGVVALFVAPWTVRNVVRLDAFVVMSTNTGDNLCVGQRPGADGGFSIASACDTGENFYQSLEAEVRHDRQLTARSLRFAFDDPLAEPGLVVRRAYRMFRDDHDALAAVQSFGTDDFISARAESRLVRLTDIVWYAVAGLGLVGMVRFLYGRRPDQLLIALVAAATAAVPVLFFGDARFKVPVVPLLVIAAAAVVADVWDSQRSSARPLPPGGADG